MSNQFPHKLYDVGAELITFTGMKVSGVLNLLELELSLPPDLDHAILFSLGAYRDVIYDESPSPLSLPPCTVTIWDLDYENFPVSPISHD